MISKGGRTGEGHGDATKTGHAKTEAPKDVPAKGGAGHGGAGSDDLTVEVRPVKVAQIEDGEALIDEGLTPGERVVVEGQYRLQAHSRVKLAQSGKAAAAEEAP